jgi:hypothetical protein
MNDDIVAVLNEGGKVAAAVLAWERRFGPLVTKKNGRVAALHSLARQFYLPYGTVSKKFYAYKSQGLPGLIDKRTAGKKFWRVTKPRGLSEEDRELVKTWCENYQRSSASAIEDLRAAWRSGEVETSTPVNPKTGYPFGWSKATLQRHGPSEYELLVARQGRGAAAAQRPLVYTTRRHLYVGQFFLFDDIWHDHEVNLLDTRQSGRPLEFHALDLASACKIGWGMRVRREVNGVNESLKTADFRFLLASILFTEGYHPDGTTLIPEHGTTVIDELTERLLAEATNGAIKVSRSGMEGAAAHAGQYAGRSKGNFRFKAALESLGNLIHNKMAALPAQTGKDRRHSPEELHGLNKYNDALLIALAQLPPARAQWLLWPKCAFTQFQIVAAEIYARINARTEHKLEGWDERYVTCRETGKLRRMSPMEVWQPGRRALRPISEEVTALIIGPEGGVERQIRSGMFQLQCAEISGDLQRFDATDLPPRGKFLTVINPFRPDSLWCFDAKGRFVQRCGRIHTPCRGDTEAVHRQIARAREQETKLLAPMRARHQRKLVAMHKNNARVLDLSRPFTAEEKIAGQRRRDNTAPMSAFLEDEAEPSGSRTQEEPNESPREPYGPHIASIEDFV